LVVWTVNLKIGPELNAGMINCEVRRIAVNTVSSGNIGRIGIFLKCIIKLIVIRLLKKYLRMFEPKKRGVEMVRFCAYGEYLIMSNVVVASGQNA